MTKQNDEIANITFVPTINPKSKDIQEKSMRQEGKDGLGNIHDVLYLNSFYRRKEQELLTQETQK